MSLTVGEVVGVFASAVGIVGITAAASYVMVTTYKKERGGVSLEQCVEVSKLNNEKENERSLESPRHKSKSGL